MWKIHSWGARVTKLVQRRYDKTKDLSSDVVQEIRPSDTYILLEAGSVTAGLPHDLQEKRGDRSDQVKLRDVYIL